MKYMNKKKIGLIVLCIVLFLAFFWKNNPKNPVVLFKTHSDSYDSIYNEEYYFVHNNQYVVYSNFYAGLKYNTLVFDAETGDEVFRINKKELKGVYDDSILWIEDNNKRQPITIIDLKSLKKFEIERLRNGKEAKNIFVDLKSGNLSLEEKEYQTEVLDKNSVKRQLSIQDFVSVKMLRRDRGINAELDDYNIENTSSDLSLYIVAPVTDGFAGIYPASSIRICQIIFMLQYAVKIISALALIALFAFGGKETQTITTTEKTCSGCGKTVSISSSAGQNCPHCGGYWGSERKT